MRNIRIFMIGWEYPPHISGGLGVACKEIAQNLADAGNEILFLVPKLHGGEESHEGVHLIDINKGWELLSAEEKILLLEKEAEFPEVIAQSLSFSAYQSKFSERALQYATVGEGIANIESSIENLEKIPSLKGGYGSDVFRDIHRYAYFASLIAKKFNPDIIHAHDWMTFPAALSAKHTTGAPVVLHVHATEYDRCGENGNPYIQDIERNSFDSCDAIITVSEYTKNIIRRRYNILQNKIFVAHNGISEHLEAMAPENDVQESGVEDPIVLFLGRITFQKGPNYFIEAAKKVIQEVKNVKFVMAGHGDLYHSMIELAADLGLGKYFHYTGFLNKEEAHKIYGMSTVYIMPSVSEPFGLTALEAMSHNLPVILSNQSGVSEVVSQCIKIDYWDTDALAEKLISFLKHKPLRSEMSSKAKDDALKVTWKETAQKILETYRSIL
ncbi:glycosyl transferase family 1 [Leptospira perolatii]|uniref:Glycosyl transferase family 1 n=1 Tax=Leptospira perolatii TaxID=2023191 RepID=A0A2M9ZNL9_9LEPT|nr:glycosyltransferase family 4 protein [Leptospira perolatii]PJZ69679.1 glycosyl transferase family 1 [Leptospira perolatii]PJZ73666.1 glycosyl transferase family 1 [Leptospira perolatii]